MGKMPILSILIAAALAGQAAACDTCPKRRIAGFDFDVTVPRPDSAGRAAWYMLFFAGPGAFDAAASDATASCHNFVDGLFVDPDRPADTLAFGVASAHTPPAGPFPAADYLLAGKVSGSYSVEVDLQCACSRENAASGAKAFGNARDALETSKSLAVQALTPIADKISAFEKAKRDGDVNVARSVRDNEGLKVIPSKGKAGPNEDVPVEIRLADCDGTPLAGRTLTLTGGQHRGNPLNPSELGVFTAASAVTGSDGVAHVVFRAGAQKGTAILRVYLIYKLPTGCDPPAAVGTASIQIEDPPADMYVIQAEWGETTISDFTSHSQFSGEGSFFSEDKRNQDFDERYMTLWAVCKKEPNADGALDLATAAVSASGFRSHMGTQKSSAFSSAAGVNSSREYYALNTDEAVVLSSSPDGPSGATFHWDDNDPGSNAFLISGATRNQREAHHWVEDSEKGHGEDHFDTSEIIADNLSLGIPYGSNGTIAKAGAGFTINLSHDTSYTSQNNVRTIKAVFLRATVRPLPEVIASGARPPRPARRVLGAKLTADLYDVLGRWTGAKRNAAGMFVPAAR